MVKALVILALCLTLSLTQNDFQTVAIIGTNDIHGSAFPKQLYRTDTQQFYNYGGLEYMATLIDIIKQEHKGNVLWLDAGDQFQGGIEASPLVSSGQIMNDFYNTLQVDASAIGNHQFDFGPNILFPYLNSRADPSLNLAANLLSDTGEQQFLPKHKNTFLYELESGIKIGVIGLSTIETPSTTGAFADGMFPNYQFEQYSQIVLSNSRNLRQQGANAVLIVSHVGNDCDANQTYGYWSSSTVQKSNCDPTDEISTLLSMLPVGTVDGIVQGHRHKFSHHFIRGVPVMGNINGGYYFNVMYLKFLNNIVYDKVIEGPIPVCEKIFSNTKLCNYLARDQLANAGSLIEWTFHGKPVVAHPKLHNIFTTDWLPKMKDYLRPLANNEILLAKVTDQESELGNLITNLIHDACSPHDFIIVNPGGFRTIWTPGVIQFQHFYNMFPFNNLLVSFEMTGYELLQTLTVIQGGKKGFYPNWGLRQRISIAGNGTRTFLGATLSNGNEIDLSKNYRVVSIDFLTNGGDDFKDVIGKIYTLRKQKNEGQMRDLLQPQLIKLGSIKEGSLIDPQNPRLEVELVNPEKDTVQVDTI